jgi:hypothetical protein
MVLCLLPAAARCTNLMQKNQFSELNQHILTFHTKFYCLEPHTEHQWRCSKVLFKLWVILGLDKRLFKTYS